MGYIGIDQLNQGMVLADDVKDMNARLLLSKGLKIESKHIRMFKMWGISEVDVVGDHDDEENTDSGNDPALIQIVADHTKELFKDIPQDVMNMNDFFKHSLACGILSRILAAHLNVQHTEQLFVSGLLHDIGRVIIYKYFPDQAKSLLTETRSSSNLLFNMESEFLGCRHTHIGRDLFRKWKLPYSLENCTYYHHTPSRSKDPLKAVVVHLADICAHALGLGTSGERFVPPLDAAACNALNIVPSTIKNVIKQGLHQLSFLESVFQEQE